MVFFKRLKRSSEGAAAIEYGLIAGIVALGIVSALVTTKGGLNGVFNQTGTQMNLVDLKTDSANAALLNGKGITAVSVTSPSEGRTTKTYTLGDGSTASYTKSAPGYPFFEEVTMIDPATRTGNKVRFDENGNLIFSQVTTYDATNTYVEARQQTTSSSNFAGNPAVPIKMSSVTFDSAGNTLTSTGTINTTQPYIDAALNTGETLKYFRDLSK